MKKIMASMVFEEILNYRKKTLEICKEQMKEGNHDYVKAVLPLLEKNINRLNQYAIIN